MAAPIPALGERFQIEEEIGRGSFGRVLRARYRTSGEPVAIKVPLGQLLPDQRARVIREASLLGRLQHRALVGFHGLFEVEDGGLALVYELVEGEDLTELCRSGPPDRELARAWVRDLAGGLDSLHDAGVLHRDLKPENIRVDGKGWARLLDYGLARMEVRGGTLTATGVILGTPEFMAPEALMGERPDRLQDLYSLAAVAFWLLEGGAPFPCRQPVELLRMHREGQRAPIRRPELASNRGSLEVVFQRALAREPGDRFPTATAFSEALDRALGEPSRGGDETLLVSGRSAAPGATTRDGLEPGGGSEGSLTPTITLPARSGAARWMPWLVAVLLVTTLALGRQVLFPGAPSPDPGGESGPRPGDTRLPPGDRAPGERSPPGPSLFPGDFGERLREELTTAAGRMDPETDRALLDPDPLLWPHIEAALPELRRFLDWLEEGGEARELPPELLSELRRTDEWYQAQDLPRPFFPFAYPVLDSASLAPLRDLDSFSVEEEYGRLPPRSPPSGWYRLLRHHFGCLVSSLRHRVHELRQERPEWVPAVVYMTVETRSIWDLYDLDTVADALFRVRDPRAYEMGRSQWMRWLETERSSLARALRATGLSLREEPGTADEVAVVASAALTTGRVALFSEYARMPPRRLLGGPAGSPQEALVHGTLLQLQRQEEFVPDREAQEDALLTRACVGGGSSGGGWQRYRISRAWKLRFRFFLETERVEEAERWLRHLRPTFDTLAQWDRRDILSAAATLVVRREGPSSLGSRELTWLADGLEAELLDISHGRERKELTRHVLSGLRSRAEAGS